MNVWGSSVKRSNYFKISEFLSVSGRGWTLSKHLDIFCDGSTIINLARCAKYRGTHY